MNKNELFARGNTYLKNNQFDLAIQDFTKIINSNPNIAEVYHNRAVAFDSLKKFDFAIQDFTKAIKLKPNLPSLFQNRGNSFKAQKKFDLAMQDYQKAIKLDPNDAKTFYYRGNTYDDMNKYDLAIQDYSMAIQIDPSFDQAYCNRGIDYNILKKFDQALMDYTKAIYLDPKNEKSYINRGNSYCDQNQYDLAMQDYSKALQLDPNNALVYYNRASIYKAQNNIDLEIQDYTRAIQLDPKYAPAYYNRGFAYSIQEKYDQAIQDYSMSISLDPNDAAAYHNRAISYKEQNNLDSAIMDLSKALSIRPDDPLYLANLGAILIAQQQFQKAKDLLLKAQNILDNVDQATLTTKFNLSAINLISIKNKIQILKAIDENSQQLLDYLKQEKTMAPGYQEKLNAIQKDIKKAVIKDTQANKEYDITNLKNILQLLQEELLDFKIYQTKVNQNVNKRFDNIEKQEYNVIATTLQSYRLPENKNKLIYYRSFCPRLLTSIEACALIQTDLFTVNFDAALQTTTEKLVNKINYGAQKASSLMTQIPIIGSVIEAILGIIEYTVGCYKEKKFQDKINNIMAVIKSKSGVLTERETEVQIAAFKIIEKISKEELNPKNFKYQKLVSEIVQIEQSQKIESASSPYWQLGIDHSLIVLKFIEQQWEQIVQDKNVEFRDIILIALNKFGQKNF